MSALHNRSPALGGLGSQLADWIAGERGAVGEDVLPRFPLARRGYDCAAVDEHVAELEQDLAALDAELAELRAQKDAQDDVTSHIKQIGEQTSAVLVAAHEQREQMLRSAR